MPSPPRLYKYETFSWQSIENLKRQIIYFGSPLNFNDPFDCALSPNIKEPTDDEVERIRAYYLQQSDLHKELQYEFRVAPTATLRDKLINIGENLVREQVLEFLPQKGVSCFSENPNNLLMWSHYGGHHKGFCLEFRTDLEPFHLIRQVKYTSDIPPIDLTSLICGRDFDELITQLFCTKSIDWQYEREWRAIHHQAGTAYCYPTDALTGIFFGSETDSTAIEIAALILAGQNEHVKYWKGQRSKSNFSLDFSPFSYISNLDARRRGLL